jgi:radical SAM/Cys-rich protein
MYLSDQATDKNTIPTVCVESFGSALTKHNLQLTRKEVTTLQVNVGLLCNQTCRHCHLEAGPTRKEIMNAATAAEVIRLAEKFQFPCIDITGGAPEMNPLLSDFLARLSSLTDNLMLRSNLTALANDTQDRIIDLCAQKRVIIVASFPSLNEEQAEAQRGHGVFLKSLRTMQKLNSRGYGLSDSGLELNLVSNPIGAFLPSAQEETEKRFRRILHRKWGIVFNNLFNFANAPLGRFYNWLLHSGNYEMYMEKLITLFNPCTVEALMCRNLISISWDGYLYDCDFNQAASLPLGGQKTHISTLDELPAQGTAIAFADHCYTCTAGSGFT